jgi:putative endonuclease
MYLYVYILECADGTFYTGITNNIDRRLAEHQEGIKPDSYTYSRRPVLLKYAESFTDYNYAISWEKRIKKWSAAKKRALILENWKELKSLAECQNGSHWLRRQKGSRLRST